MTTLKETMRRRKDESLEDFKERRRLTDREYRKRNPEKQKAYVKKYIENNYERVRKMDSLNQKKYHDRDPITMSKKRREWRIKLKLKAIGILGGKCVICGSIKGIEVSSTDNIPLREKGRQFKDTAVVYMYCRDNPEKAKEIMQIRCQLHRNNIDRGKKENWTEDGIKRHKVSRATRIFPREDSTIEEKLQNKLRELGIAFEPHKFFDLGEFTHKVDIFIEPNICVEADGEYWHTKLIRKNDKISPLQREYQIDTELEKRGYKLYRFSGHDIRKNLDWVINIIKSAIKVAKFSQETCINIGVVK